MSEGTRQMQTRYDPQRRRGALAGDLGGRGPLQRRPRPVADAVRRRAPAAERHGRAAHGARAPARARRHDRPHEADAGLQRALPAGLRPRRHLDAERGREAAPAGGHVAPGARPRGVRGARLGVAARVRRHDHGPVPAHGRLARLPPRAVHDGPRLRPRRAARSSCTSTRSGWIYRANRIINWCPYHHTSLSDLELDARGPRRHALDDPLPARGRRRLRSRSRPCVRRRSRPTSPLPCIPTTSATGTSIGREVDRPVGRAARAGDRRRARRARRSAPARSRSRRATTRPTSRSAATTGSPSRSCIGPGRASSRAEGLDGLDPGGGRAAGSSTGAASAACSRSASTTATPSRCASAASRGSSR